MLQFLKLVGDLFAFYQNLFRVVAQVLDEIVAKLLGKLDKIDKGREKNQRAGLLWCVQVLGVEVFYLSGPCEAAPRKWSMRFGIEGGGRGRTSGIEEGCWKRQRRRGPVRMGWISRGEDR
jgi:hypothetical protein